MVNSEGKPMLIDPAVYYGNREAEIAFTRLFGGFEEAFYTAYQEEYPFEKGFEDRMDIYNLYPLLVHVNLFGSGYLSGVERILKKYLG
jgi:fructosamine-3-kinase